MSLDYQQLHEQVRKLGENAPRREAELRATRQQANECLDANANELDRLRRKVELARSSDPALRCALPVNEALNAHFPAPALPQPITVLAADGSQINPDRHAEIEYCLINVGAIQMRLDSPEPPASAIRSQLLYDQELYTATGTITENLVALRRDLAERKALVELAAQIPPPLVTFTDGPMELWGGKDEDGAGEFQKSLQTYLATLENLHEMGVITAGYVDKPGADVVVRLLEVAATPEDKLHDIRSRRPYRGVADADLYRDLLNPGERSAVFAMQSQSAQKYSGALGLHFFYLNVGRLAHPWLARVEIPRWVAENPQQLDSLHAVLLHQCQIMGGRPYPYLLHRAHETAVVTLEEKEQLTQMIVLELRRRGVQVGEISYKQSAKGLPRRTRL